MVELPSTTWQKREKMKQKSSTIDGPSQGTSANIGEEKPYIDHCLRLYWPQQEDKMNGEEQSCKWCGTYYQREEDDLIHYFTHQSMI